MPTVAVIEAGGEAEIDDAAWQALIDEHSGLSRPGPRSGINPFTKKPITIPARPDLAIAVAEGRRIGFIEWAQNGERILLARTDDDADADAAILVGIAQDVARCLGANCNTEHDLVRFSKAPPVREPPRDPVDRAIALWDRGDKEGAVASYMASMNVDFKEALRALLERTGRR